MDVVRLSGVILLVCIGCGSNPPARPVLEPAAKITTSQSHNRDLRPREEWFGIPAWASAIEEGDLFQVRFWVESGIMSVHQRLQWLGEQGYTDRGALRGIYGRPEYPEGGMPVLHVLHIAARHGRPSVALYFLDQGVEVDVFDESESTALMHAVNSGPLSLVKLLVQRGANVSWSDIYADTPLIGACWGGPGQLLIVQYLVEQGASVNQVSRARKISMRAQPTKTPLWAAVFHNLEESLAIMTYLIEKGAWVNWQDETGSTALMTAAWRGHEDHVRLLVSSGANLDLRNSDGETAAEQARRRGRIAIADYLDSLMAVD